MMIGRPATEDEKNYFPEVDIEEDLTTQADRIEAQIMYTTLITDRIAELEDAILELAEMLTEVTNG